MKEITQEQLNNLTIAKEKIYARFSEFNLNVEQYVLGKDPGLTYNLTKVANFLTEKLSRDISERNVFELCLKNNFSAYIDRRYHFLDYFPDDKDPIILRTDDEVKKPKYFIDKKYQYPYKGLLKLIKFGHHYSLEFLMLNKKIIFQFDKYPAFTLRKNCAHPFQIQRSFSDYLMGLDPFVLVQKIDSPVLITWEDLIFIEEELNYFAETYKNPEKNKNKNENKKAINVRVLSETIETIIFTAKNRNISINKNFMPGTKKELFSLLKHVQPELSELIKAQATCNDYFSNLDLKFKPGNKTGKCAIFKELCELFGFSN